MGSSCAGSTPSVEVRSVRPCHWQTAHALWEESHLDPGDQARFHTRSGLLTARRKQTWIEMDFPAKPEEPCAAPEGLAEALGATPKYVGRNAFDYIVELDSEGVLRQVEARIFPMLLKLPVRGVIVTSLAADYDFVSRFFAPGSGIDEDPVTGSAHCCLGPFWSSRLGRNEFIAYQASLRGGLVHVHLEGDRVILGGQAVTVLRGGVGATKSRPISKANCSPSDASGSFANGLRCGRYHLLFSSVVDSLSDGTPIIANPAYGPTLA